MQQKPSGVHPSIPNYKESILKYKKILEGANRKYASIFVEIQIKLA